MFSLGGLRKAGPSLEHRLIPKVSPISDGQMKTLVGRSFSGGRRSKTHRTCARRGAGGGYCGNLSEDVRPEFFLRARRGFLHREGERREALMVRAHADGAQGRKGKKSGRPPGGSRPDHALTAGKNYFFSVTMRFVSTTSNVSPVFTRPRTSVSSAGIDQALTTFSAATSISTRTLWFLETAKRLPFS